MHRKTDRPAYQSRLSSEKPLRLSPLQKLGKSPDCLNGGLVLRRRHRIGPHAQDRRVPVTDVQLTQKHARCLYGIFRASVSAAHKDHAAFPGAPDQLLLPESARGIIALKPAGHIQQPSRKA